MMNRLRAIWCSLFFCVVAVAHPVDGLLERIEEGLSGHFIIEEKAGAEDYFCLSQRGDKVVVEGNNPVSIAVGVNTYLEQYAHVQLSWDGMKTHVQRPLPRVRKPLQRVCSAQYRYYLNYCTFSYSTAFWGWERWQQEIDWMVLHGVNLALATTGTECVYRDLLLGMGYSADEVGRFIGGPGFLAWWNMGNLEGWGGPLPDSWYAQQQRLQQQIVGRMREYGIAPVMVGYGGMLPSEGSERLGLHTIPTGVWCGFQRPAVLPPTDEAFPHVAERYYHIMDSLYGGADYYAIDPFHEGGDASALNLTMAGRIIYDVMQAGHPDATWVIQAWEENPRPQLISLVPRERLLILSLNADAERRVFPYNDYVYCSLLNYGGNVGLFGRVDALMEGWNEAVNSANCKGVGISSEGIGQNAVMHDLVLALPWQGEKFSMERWLKGYVRARYGRGDGYAMRAWRQLMATVYNCPSPRQQGTRESVFCARPGLDVKDVSAWAQSEAYYSMEDVEQAARWMRKAGRRCGENAHYRYDRRDVERQLNAEWGRRVLDSVRVAYEGHDVEGVRRGAEKFLSLIMRQDSLLAGEPLFTLAYYLKEAEAKGGDEAERAQCRWNLLRQITTWGPRAASEGGGLHDYAHREWSGVLGSLYYERWNRYFSYLIGSMEGKAVAAPEFYDLDTLIQVKGQRLEVKVKSSEFFVF